MSVITQVNLVKEKVGERSALSALFKVLLQNGYKEFCSSFSPLTPRINEWIKHRDDADEELKTLIDLFLLSNPVSYQAASSILGSLVDELEDLGLFQKKGDCVSMHNIILYTVFGNWLFCQKPGVNPKLYFGDDSVALLNRLSPSGRCLDLCSGPGIQALFCSNFASKVDAVEINPIAAQLAQLNVLANNKDDRVSIFCGDLYEPIMNNTYDTICANPPLLPFPEETFYPFVGHGGDDGMKITWRILEGLDAHLSATGHAQIIGTGLSDGILPNCTDRLDEWAKNNNMDVIMTITAHQPLNDESEYLNGLVYTSASSHNNNVATIKQSFMDLLSRLNATHLCAYFFYITRGTGKLKIIDMSVETDRGLWYVR